MRYFAKRTLRNSLLLIIGILVFTFLLYEYNIGLYLPDFFSGWILFISMIMLGLYNIRKKISILPLLSNSIWLQVHIYLGLFAVWFFLMHISWSFPEGRLELAVAILFFIVIVSGFYGLYITRVTPRILTVLSDEEIIYERIPEFNKKLQIEAETLIQKLVEDEEHTGLSQYYKENLYDFFAKKNPYLKYFIEPVSYIDSVLYELENQGRYLNKRERQYSNQLKALILKRHDLNLHYTYQSQLKYWLFIHIPTTYSLYIISAFHIVSSYVLRSGIN